MTSFPRRCGDARPLSMPAEWPAGGVVGGCAPRSEASEPARSGTPRRLAHDHPFSGLDVPTQKDLSLLAAVLAPAQPSEHPGGGLAIDLGMPHSRETSTFDRRPGPPRWDSREAGILRPVVDLCGKDSRLTGDPER